MLGDSQAWGYGVGDDDTIPAQLGRLLNDGGGGHYEVLNLGVGGYGTDQAFLKYLVQGARYAPDAVVLTVFKNDPVENAHTVYWGVEKPRFYLEGGRLCLGNVPPARAPGWPNNRLVADREPSFRLPGTQVDLARSATARFFMRREWLPSLLARDDGGLAAVRAHVDCIRNRDAYEGDGMEILARLVADLEKITAAQGARLVLLLVRGRRRSRIPPARLLRPRPPGLPRPGDRLRRPRRRLGQHGDEGAPFLPNDPHLSAAGSRIAALALRDCLARPGAPCDLTGTGTDTS